MRAGRTVARGDVSPSLQPATLARHVAQQAVPAADGQQTSAVLSSLGSDDATQTTQERIDSLRALLAGASQDDLDALREALRQHMDRGDEESDDSVNPDEELARDWRRVPTLTATCCAALPTSARSSVCRSNCSSCRPGSRRHWAAGGDLV